MNIKNLLLRSLSGIIYVGIIIGCIFWGLIPVSCMGVLFGTLAIVEFEKICEGFNPNRIPVLIFDICAVICLAFIWVKGMIWLWICIILLRMILELYIKSPQPILCLVYSLGAQIYIGIPMACMALIAKTSGLHLLLAIFLMIWINDTGAFLIGSLLGRNRLFERISPKKSWEGFFGGLAFNLLAGWLFAIGGKIFWGTGWPIGTWLCFATIVTVFSTWGDLLESLIKRTLNIKDSGNLIPGHGGILDRIDSLLLVMPATLIFIVFVNHFILNQ